MKKVFLLLMLGILSISASCQDTISLPNGQRLIPKNPNSYPTATYDDTLKFIVHNKVVNGKRVNLQLSVGAIKDAAIAAISSSISLDSPVVATLQTAFSGIEGTRDIAYYKSSFYNNSNVVKDGWYALIFTCANYSASINITNLGCFRGSLKSNGIGYVCSQTTEAMKNGYILYLKYVNNNVIEHRISTNGWVFANADLKRYSDSITQHRIELDAKASVQSLFDEEAARIAADALKANASDVFTKAQTNLNFLNKLTYQNDLDASIASKTELAAAITNITASTDSLYQKKVGLTTSNNIAYVSRKWTGIRGGASWLSQLAAAVVGSPVATFPDIWVARDVMARLLVQNSLKNATIVIYEDEKFTAAQISEGGVVDFNYPAASINARYHPYPSTKGTGFDSLCMNLFFPNLTYDFKRGSGITHTSGRGRLGLPYDTLAPQIIRGDGIFNFKYNNWTGSASTNVDWLTFAGKGYVEFSADSIRVSRVREDKFGWGVISSFSTTGIAKFRANYFSTFDHNGPFRGLSNFDCRIATLEVDTTQLPYNNDGSLSFSAWFLHSVTRSDNENVIINIDNAKLRGMGLFSINDYGIKNAKIYLSATNISQSYLPQYISVQVPAGNSATNSELFRYSANGSALNNSQIFCNVKNYKGQMSAISLLSNAGRVIKNSQIKLQFDNYIQDSIPGVTQKVSFNSTLLSDSSLVTISGNFVNEKEAVLKLANDTKVDFRGVFKTQSTTKSAIELSGTNINSKFLGALSVAGTQESISGTGTITVFPSATANTAPAVTVTQNGSMILSNSAYKY